MEYQRLKDLGRKITVLEQELYAVRQRLERRWCLGSLRLEDGEENFAGITAQSFFFFLTSTGDPDEPFRVQATQLSYPLDMQPARILRRIAAVKQLYEDWMAGKIAEIPADEPIEILRIQ